MRVPGFLLLIAGWSLVLAAVVLFAGGPSRAFFVACGFAVEVLGLVFVFRSHLIPKEDKR